MDTHLQMPRAHGQHLPRTLVGGFIRDTADLIRELLAMSTAIRKSHGHFPITPFLLRCSYNITYHFFLECS